MYQAFADVYDQLMDTVDYTAWARHYQAMMLHADVPARRVLDCACGTGNMTLALARLGLIMTGSDLSVEMLRQAAEKARRQGLQIPFVRQDLRKLRLHRPMDAIVCACDGVNYLLQEADVLAFFQAAYEALRPGGGLFFDISSRHKLETQLANCCYGEDREQVCYFWQNHYSQGKRIVQMDLTFFVQEPDGRYARFCETHYQRAHTIEELLAWLRAAGFAQVEVFGEKGLLKPEPDAHRIHFCAIRPE